MLGSIFNIQRFSLHDGPGIRTTIFMKGCNLRCKWCHNPESFERKPQLEFFKNRCVNCGRCVTVCPHLAMKLIDKTIEFDRSLCQNCFACTKVCLQNAREAVGELKDSQNAMETVLRDKPFYESSGGGATFSGGEPLLQHEFLLDMLHIAKENNLHTAVDTAAHVPIASLQAILPLVDLFLVDLKLFDNERHKLATGVDNVQILENIKFLSSQDATVCIRIPIITGYNDDDKNMKDTAAFLLNETKLRHVELLSFHKLAESKYDNLELDYAVKDLSPLPKERMQELANILISYGILAKYPE